MPARMRKAKRRKKPTGGWILLFPALKCRTTATEAQCREYRRAAAGLLLAFSMTDAELTAHYARQETTALAAAK